MLRTWLKYRRSFSQLSWRDQIPICLVILLMTVIVGVAFWRIIHIAIVSGVGCALATAFHALLESLGYISGWPNGSEKDRD